MFNWIQIHFLGVSYVTVLQSLGKMPSRLDQIRLEETVAQRDQEAAHERYR